MIVNIYASCTLYNTLLSNQFLSLKIPHTNAAIFTSGNQNVSVFQFPACHINTRAFVEMTCVTLFKFSLEVIQTELSIHITDEYMSPNLFNNTYGRNSPCLRCYCLYTSGSVQVPQSHISVVSTRTNQSTVIRNIEASHGLWMS